MFLFFAQVLTSKRRRFQTYKSSLSLQRLFLNCCSWLHRFVYFCLCRDRLRKANTLVELQKKRCLFNGFHVMDGNIRRKIATPKDSNILYKIRLTWLGKFAAGQLSERKVRRAYRRRFKARLWAKLGWAETQRERAPSRDAEQGIWGAGHFFSEQDSRKMTPWSPL